MDYHFEISDEECMKIDSGYYEKQQFDHFLDFFYDNLDSDYGTDFFLCDKCIHKFRNNWAGIDIVNRFYEDNMILLVDKFDYPLTDDIDCPYCGTYLKNSSHIWPCRLSIRLNKYVNEINQIAATATKAPFLLLKEKFAEDVYDFIMNISKKTNAMQINETLYRCRQIENPDKFKDMDDLERTLKMGAPPYYKASEGRFNHNGFSHLYVATSGIIAYKELKNNGKQPNYIAEFETIKPLKILDLTDIDGDVFNNELYMSIISSSLIYNSPTNNKGWDKPEYIFSRFIADCAIHSGFDGIKYKSRYINKGDNFIIFNDKIDSEYPKNQAYKHKTDYEYSEEETIIDLL